MGRNNLMRNNIFLVKKNTLYSIIVVIFFSLVVGNRGRTNDTQVYYDLFRDINFYNLFDPVSFYNDTGMEPGIGFVFNLISFFSQSSFIVFSIISFLIFIFYFLISQNLKLNPLLLLVIYICSGFFIFQQFMQIRQGLSTFIFIYASLCLFDRKYFLAILGFFLAIFIHQSAILPVCFSIAAYVFLWFFNINKFKFLVINFFAVIISFLIAKNFLINYLILSSERIEGYVGSSYGGEVSFLGFNNIRLIICYLFIFILFLKKFEYNDKKMQYLFMALSVGIGMKFGMLDIDILSGRLTAPFIFAEIFLMVKLVQLNFTKRASYIFLMLYTIGLFIPAYFIQIDLNEFLNLYFTPLR